MKKKFDLKLAFNLFTIISFFSIIVYILLLFFYDYNYFIEIKYLKNLFEYDIINSTQFVKCSPFKTNYKHFEITFANETYPKSLPLHLNDSIDFNCLNKSSDIKKILFWNPIFGDVSYGFGIGKIWPLAKNRCPVTSCELLNDKSRINESDLVLVHMRDSYTQFPSYRPNNQRWVFVLYESPVHAGDFTSLDGFFNMTSTYKIDSDFPGLYSTLSGIVWTHNSKFNDSIDYLNNKTHFAAAVISNCGGSSRRLEYIKEMQNHIQVNVFGKCGIPCPTNCKETISYQYKFYLAFENSICYDYITEKFFEILKYPIIPVVLGGGKYEHYIPKSGFINANDFKTPKDLADYLIYLNKNSTAYNSYFKWKKYVEFKETVGGYNPVCDMCVRLQLDSYIGIKKNILHNYCSKKDCH